VTEQKSLIKKLAGVMAEVGTIPRRGRNPHFGYDFVQEEDVSEALRDKLAKRNIVVIPSVVDHMRRDNVTVLKVELTYYDGDSGESITSIIIGEGSDTQDKGSNKALTAAVKYGLLKAFLIASGDDADRQGPTPEPQASSRARPTPAPAKKLTGPPVTDSQRTKIFELSTQVPLEKRELFYRDWLPGKGFVGSSKEEQFKAFMEHGGAFADELMSWLKSLTSKPAAPNAKPEPAEATTPST
jgi:ERF superfamily protein